MAEAGKDLTPADELNQRLDRMAKRGMEKTKEWVDMWSESLRYFFSDQLHGKRQHKGWEWVIINYIWPSAIQELAKLSRNDPKIVASPWDDTDADAAEVWASHLNWLWRKGLNKRGMRLDQIAATLDAKIFGYWVSKVYWEGQVDWDDRNKRWIGDVKHKLWHPAFFWVDPEAEHVDEAECLGTERFVRLEWALQRWPKFAKDIKEQATTYKPSEIGGWGGPNIRGQLSGSTTSGTGGSDPGVDYDHATRLLSIISGSDKMSQPVVDEDVKFVKISEAYFKDYEMVSQRIETPVSSEQLMAQGALKTEQGAFYAPDGTEMTAKNWPKNVKAWKEPKYPKGRYVIRAGKVILNPETKDMPDAQKYPYGQWPFIVTPHYLLPHMWQGTDGVQMYKTHQDMINVSVSHLANNMKQFGAPRIAVEDGAIAKNPRTRKAYKIGVGAGAVIRLVRGAIKDGRYKIHDPTAPSTATLQLYHLFTQEFRNVVGLQSISKGEKQKGEMSATEAQHLAMSSNDRIQLQSVYHDEWIKRVCGLVAEICQAHYEPQRFIRIVGEDNILGVQQINQRLKDIRFDADVLPATTLPFDAEKRTQKHLVAYQILSQPIVNPMLPQILRDLQVDNWKKLLQQHEPWMKWMQFLQVYQAVKAGEILPQDAIKIMLTNIVDIAPMLQTPEEMDGKDKKDAVQEKKKKKKKT